MAFLGIVAGIFALKIGALGGIFIADKIDREIAEIRENGGRCPNSKWKDAFFCSPIGKGKRRKVIRGLFKPKSKNYKIHP